MTTGKHKHKWQFVKEYIVTTDGFFHINKTSFKFACECGKSKCVDEIKIGE